MEAREGFEGNIRPPRLEDAGLEDCALPPESIKQAFLKAASAVRSRATSILSQSDADDADATCIYDPWPITIDSSDALVGITPETGSPGSCAGKQGEEVPESLGDKVVEGLSDADVEKGDELVGVEGVSEGGEFERFEDRKGKDEEGK